MLRNQIELGLRAQQCRGPSPPDRLKGIFDEPFPRDHIKGVLLFGRFGIQVERVCRVGALEWTLSFESRAQLPTPPSCRGSWSNREPRLDWLLLVPKVSPAYRRAPLPPTVQCCSVQHELPRCYGREISVVQILRGLPKQ